MELDDEFQDLEPVGSFPHASDNVMKDRKVVKARRGAGGFPPLVQSIDDEPFSVDGIEEELGFEGDLDELLGMDENIRANDPNLDVVDLGSESAYDNVVHVIFFVFMDGHLCTCEHSMKLINPSST
jgi:hypothetical protein